MTKTLVLTPAERDFFKMAAQAAFTNPFSQNRIELDRKIAGTDKAMSWDNLVELAITRIIERLAQLRKSERDDRELLGTAFLFDIYHRYRLTFDDFIHKQLAAGDTPIPVPFAKELLSAMAALGLDESGCHRQLGIFYQIRRAFYFIETALTGLSGSMLGLRLQLWN